MIGPLSYNSGRLQFDGIELSALAEQFGTPLYVYSDSYIRSRITGYRNGAGNRKHLICYAVKACSTLGILRTMAEEGCGADIVSGGELFRALRAGIKADRIVFSGVGKAASEIEAALDAGIMLFSVESEGELEAIAKTAREKKKKANISIRINPNVDAKTHPYISTGLRSNKFGIPAERALDLYRKARGMEWIEPAGAGFHIGSQLTGLSPFEDAAAIVRKIALELIGEGIALRYIDAGGGLGIYYNEEKPPEPADYVKKLLDSLNLPDLTVIFEPGRSLVGNAGVLISRVLYTKKNHDKKFIVCDAAMNDLIRPSLYQAYHEILPEKQSTETEVADLVGPVCETGDFLAKDRAMAPLESGDLLAIASAGAYAFSMASNYNSRTRAAEVLIENGQARLIRKRETFEDLIRGEL